MKRLFILFAVLAFTACTNEEPLPGSDLLNGETGTPTFATFTFNASDASTKSSMITDENETNVINDVRVLIFNNASGLIEVDTSLITSSGNSMITVTLLSGSKRILAIANADNDMLPAKGSSSAYADFSSAIYNISNTDPVSDPATGIDNLSNLVNPAGYVMTNATITSVITVDPDISANESQDPSNNNHLSIDLQRAVAKVTVYQDADASSLTTIDGSGTLSDLKYSIINVNRSLYLFQNYVGNILQTPEYIPTQSIDPLIPVHYYGFYDYRELLTDLSASKAIYITENNPSLKLVGNTTFIAIEAIFKPKRGHFTEDISYDEISGVFAPILSETNLETASDIYRFTRQGVTGLNHGTLLAGVDAGKLARKVIYHLLNPTVPPKANLDDPVYATITDDQIEAYFDKYTDGKCYYRLGIGNQTSENLVDYVVIRNHHYRVNITRYARIGTSQMGLFAEPENEDEDGGNYITASFNVVEWTVEDISSVG
jgi:hypothetical protein